MADYRQPITYIMRRYHAWTQRPPARGQGRIERDLAARRAAEADLALITEWLDKTPELACSPYFCRLHGPAEPEPYTPPKYRRPQ